jgi:phosphopantothenoylcysteine synthetase/decarboxylase
LKKESKEAATKPTEMMSGDPTDIAKMGVIIAQLRVQVVEGQEWERQFNKIAKELEWTKKQLKAVSAATEEKFEELRELCTEKYTPEN